VSSLATNFSPKILLEEPMRHSAILFMILIIFIVSLAGCELAADIFKAGVWVGVLLVIAIIGVIVWAISRGSK
jgi:hypothetical protein